MKTQKLTFLRPGLLLAGLFCTATTTLGELTTFTVDPIQSSLTISVRLTTLLGSFTLQEQAPGSLTTTYEGSVKAEITPSSIAFVGGSVVLGRNSGDWQPGLGGVPGSAPANYGGRNTMLVSAFVAMRKAWFDLTSGALPVSGGAFPAAAIIFSFPTNANSVLDYSVAGYTSGSFALTSYATNRVAVAGTLVKVGDEWVLTVPVDYTGYAWLISPNDCQYTLTGQLVARATVAKPPLEVHMNCSPDQLAFTINTTPGGHYTILSRTNLMDTPVVFDAFTATGDTSTRTNGNPGLPMQFFQVRRDY